LTAVSAVDLLEKSASHDALFILLSSQPTLSQASESFQLRFLYSPYQEGANIETAFKANVLGIAAFVLIGMVVPQGIGASETINALNPLFGALPAARFISLEGWERIRTADFPLAKISGIFLGESSDGKKEGVVIHVITPGYGGDIALLVSFDMEGRLLRVPIIKHDETQCHVPGLKDGSFLGQFLGLGLADKIRLMVGRSKERIGDIDAMSGGTVTSRALADGIAEARIGFYLARSAGLLEPAARLGN
jgi:hypothetical protein